MSHKKTILSITDPIIIVCKFLSTKCIFLLYLSSKKFKEYIDLYVKYKRHNFSKNFFTSFPCLNNFELLYSIRSIDTNLKYFSNILDLLAFCKVPIYGLRKIYLTKRYGIFIINYDRENLIIYDFIEKTRIVLTKPILYTESVFFDNKLLFIDSKYEGSREIYTLDITSFEMKKHDILFPVYIKHCILIDKNKLFCIGDTSEFIFNLSDGSITNEVPIMTGFNTLFRIERSIFRIYGEYDTKNIIIYIFDFKENIWKYLNKFDNYGSGYSILPFHKKIYFISGFDKLGNKRLDSFLIYNIKKNIFNQQNITGKLLESLSNFYRYTVEYYS